MNSVGACGRHFCFEIYGKSNTAIAATATFFWALKHQGERPCLVVRDSFTPDEPQFDFQALQPKQLSRILDANPKRSVVFRYGVWNEKQSVIWATRSHPMELAINDKSFGFEDEGTAFVDALGTRQSSFGSISITCAERPAFSPDNLKRLLKLEIFDALTISNLFDDDVVLLPFLTKVNALKYDVDAQYIQPEVMRSLPIVTKDLNLNIYFDYDDDEGRNWDAVLISFFDRVAQLGHFERLEFSAHPDDTVRSCEYRSVAEAMMRAVNSNPKLVYFDLKSDSISGFDWTPHMQYLLRAMEDNIGLRTLKLVRYPPEDPNYSWLEQLLSRNRKITVVDETDEKYTNGPRIDSLYALNRFYQGATSLVTESASLRPLLVAAAVVETASEQFHLGALLLAKQTRILCEFIADTDLEDIASQSVSDEPALPACIPSEPNQTATLKRKSEIQPSSVAKKVAQHRET